MSLRRLSRRDFLKIAITGVGTIIAVEVGERLFSLKPSTQEILSASTNTREWTPSPTTSPAPSATSEVTATSIPLLLNGKVIERRILATKIPIIEYHYLGYSAGGVAETEELFLSQMGFFELNGSRTVNDVELGKFIKGEIELPAKTFAIRIDQGAAHFAEFEKMLEVFEEKGFSALVFVISGEQYSEEQWQKLASWYKKGIISLGSHSATHPDFTKIDHNQAYDEAVASKKVIQDRISQYGIEKEIIGFAFPYDSVPENVDFLKTAGYQFGLGGNLFGVENNSAVAGEFILPTLYPYVMQSLLDTIQANQSNNPRSILLTCGYPFDEMVYMNTTPIMIEEITEVINKPYQEITLGEFRELPISEPQKRSLIRPVGIIIHTDDQGGDWFEFWNTSVTYDSLNSRDSDVHFAVDRHGIAQFLRMYPDFCTPSRGAKGFMDYISIEMCGRDYNQVLDPNADKEKVAVIKETTENTIGLVRTLFDQYGIDPVNVMGHYQATASGKTDPGKDYFENYFLPLLRKSLA